MKHIGQQPTSPGRARGPRWKRSRLLRERLRFAGACVGVLGVCHGSAALADITRHLAVHRPRPGASAVRTTDGLTEGIPGGRPALAGTAINGATAYENSYLLEGLSANDPATGANALPLSAEFLTNVNVITSGYMAEYGRATGGIIEADLKGESFSAFTGSLFGYWAPGVLSARDISGRGPLKHQGDFGATLSGPLVRKRLAFFAGVAPAFGRVERTLAADGTSRTFFADQRTVQGAARLRYLLGNDHSLSLSFITTPSSSRGIQEERTSAFEAEAPRDFDSNASSVRLKYNGSFFDHRMLMDAHAGALWQRVSPASGEGLRAQDQLQAHMRVTYLLYAVGTHVLKAGVDTERVMAESSAEATRQVLGAYVQDSWTLASRYTLNFGLRTDAQELSPGVGAPTQRVGGTLVPRLGLVMDPYANGRMRVFAHLAKYEGLVPTGLLTSPVRSVTVDPDLKPPASRELLVGAEYELFASATVGASYTHRQLDAALQYLAHGEGTGVLLGNPGEGLAAGTPEAERTYQAATFWLDAVDGQKWKLRLSYTRSRLRGNTSGLLPLPAEPGFAAAAEPVVLSDSEGLLPADRAHLVKAYVARDFSVARNLNADVGLSYLGASGRPRAEGGRTPWGHTLDVHVGMGYWLARGSRVEVSLDVFNILNAQDDARWDGSTPLSIQAPRQVRLGARYLFL